MMKKLLIAGSVLLMNIANGQDQPHYQTGSITRNFTPNPVTSLVSGVTDSLNYFYNKNFFCNTQATQNSFWTIKQAINSISSHHGSIYMNSSTLKVHGLEGLVMRVANSTSTMVPVKLYLCNVNNTTNLPVFPALDSVITGVSNSTGGVFVGGTFTAPVTVTGKFAVLFRNGSSNSGDTVALFMNNAAAPTSTSPANQKFGENLGVRRTNGSFASNTNYYGNGRDWEFVVSAWVSFDLDAEISVTTPTICTNSTGSFSNISTPAGMLDNRQFNFNRFYDKWAPVAIPSNTQIVLTTPDSTYQWAFTGANITTSYAKHAPSVMFNTTGNQTADLTVRYRQQANLGTNNSITDNDIKPINVTNSAAPVIAIAGPTAICSGSSATLTASGNTTFTWTSPASQQNSVVVSPSSTTIYTVSGSNLGCVGTQTAIVNVNTAPTVAVSSPTAACAGALFTLTASGANTYTWDNGNTTASNAVSSATGGVNASFTVTGEKQGCPVSIKVIAVPINEKPEVTLFADANKLCSKATTGTSVALSGDPTGGVYSGQGVSFGRFTPNNAGTFVATYSYTDAATGCSNKATTQMVVVVCDITGLNEGTLNNNISAFPNPAVNGKVTVINLEGSNVIAVYNILGSVVAKEVVNNSQYNLDLSSQSEGTYFMRITDSTGGVKTVKIVNSK